MSIKFSALIMQKRDGSLTSMVAESSNDTIAEAKKVRTSGKFGKIDIERGEVFNQYRSVYKFRCEKPVKK